MRWLHLSDLHFSPEAAGLDTLILLEDLRAYIKEKVLRAEHLFLTGDFRYAKHIPGATAAEIAAYIHTIADAANVPYDNIHIVPGNHDLTRSKDEEVKKKQRSIRDRYKGANGMLDEQGCAALLEQFNFFQALVRELSLEDVWGEGIAPAKLHTTRSFPEFHLLCLNTAITHWSGADRKNRRLIVGSVHVYHLLQQLAREAPNLPIIVLAHHSPDYFTDTDAQNLEKIFSRFPQCTLYLCGDAHTPRSRTINQIPQLTAGCLTHGTSSEVVFYSGEMLGGKFLPPTAHFWNYGWAIYQQRTKIIADQFKNSTHPNLGKRVDFVWHNLPPENVLYTTRIDLENDITAAFQQGTALALTQTLTGLGGVGKTLLAQRYAHTHKEQGTYDHIWWVNAASEAHLQDAYRSFAEKYQLGLDLKASSEDCIKAVRNWMDANDKWLFIFDNADGFVKNGKPIDPDLVLPDYLPRQKNPKKTQHVLITTRYAGWPIDVADSILVKVFTKDQALNFMAKATRLTPDESGDELIIALGLLPLALGQAAAFIKNNGISYQYYFELFKESRERLLQENPKADLNDLDYERKIVATTWNLSREKLTKESSRQLLILFAFFAVDNIDVEWLRQDVDCLPEPLRKDVADKFNYLEVLTELHKYSLITREQGKVSIHRLLQAVVQDGLTDDEQQKTLQCCLNILHACSGFKISTAESFTRYRALVPHLLAVLEQGKLFSNTFSRNITLKQADCWDFLGEGAYELGEFDTALGFYENVRTIREAELGTEHLGTASVYNRIACAYHNKGKYNDALELYKKACTIRETELGKEDLETAWTYNNIAATYQADAIYNNNLEKLDDALKLFENVRIIREKKLGIMDKDTAAIYNNIALNYYIKGEYDAAIKLHKTALNIRIKVLGREHLETAMSYRNLARAYCSKGKYDYALKLHKISLHIKEDIVGSEHQATATTYSEIANVYFHKEEYETAFVWYAKALPILIAKLGFTHSFVQRVLVNARSAYTKSQPEDDFDAWVKSMQSSQ